jgi:hypothetical protein
MNWAIRSSVRSFCLLGVDAGIAAPMNGHPDRKQDLQVWGATVHTYGRPVLTTAGSFDKVTGLSILGPRETLLQYQLF